MNGGYLIPPELLKHFPMHMRYSLEEYQEKFRFYADEYNNKEN